MSSEQYFTQTYLENVDEGHHLADEILDLSNVGIRLEYSRRKAAFELILDRSCDGL